MRQEKVQRRFGRGQRQPPEKLAQAVALVLLALLVVTGLLIIGLSELVLHTLPWDRKDKQTSLSDVVRLGFYAVAGLGGAVGLTVAYRRQRDLEANQFTIDFGAATAQLGGEDPAVRLGGVYAIAALADRYPERRQQCIDVLCGYLRLPYTPQGDQLLDTTVVEDNRPARSKGRGPRGQHRVERTYLAPSRRGDKEVRLTIITVIRDHLRDGAPVSWQGHDFNFTGAVFDGGSFEDAVFSGGAVRFHGAEFSGGEVSFNGAEFSGGAVYFGGAQFSGGAVRFDEAEFSGGAVRFDEAEFSGGAVRFGGAVFSRGAVYFGGAVFSDGAVYFGGAVFSGGEVSFDGAVFSDGEVSFFGAQFSGSVVSFGGAVFSGGEVSFVGAVFSGGEVRFFGAWFFDGEVRFDGAGFTGSAVYFGEAEFSGVRVRFGADQGATVDELFTPEQLATWCIFVLDEPYLGAKPDPADDDASEGPDDDAPGPDEGADGG